jgi:ABC-type multidrug transport system ATPase subunit
MNEAALCGRVIVMDKGKIAMDGTPGEIFTRTAELGKIGLTIPQTAAFAQGLGIRAAPLTEEECAEVIWRHYKTAQYAPAGD